MTNGAGPSGGLPSSYTSMPNPGNVPRRLSYASVASGAAQSHASPRRAEHLSQMSNPSSSYPPQHPPDYRLHRPHSIHETEMSSNGSVPFGSAWRKSQPLPSYSRQFAHIPPYGVPLPANSFFTPSYLRHSRYVARLEAAHKAKESAKRDISPPSSNPASLSTSASNVNMPRIAPSHRGMTYDVIESSPPTDDDQLMPLPSRWSDPDRHPALDLLADGLEIRYNGGSGKIEHEATAVRADYPMSPQCGIYYFEVEIKNKTKDGMIAVGFSTQKASLERLPGWETDSWAYHGDDGKIFFGESQGRSFGPTFTTGDIIGCGINFHTGQGFFTKNGVDLGCAFRELKKIRPFPSVGMKKYSGACARVNFGHTPFLFDIDGVVASEQRLAAQEIEHTSVAKLRPPLDETALVQELVAHFLAHDGYVETAKAFAEERRREKVALRSSKDDGMDFPVIEDDLDAVNRQKIRASILEGDIDKALKHTNAYYSDVLQDNPEIVFRLKCRKWVELIRKSSDLQGRTAEESRRSGYTRNGHTSRSKSTVEDVFDQDMELDEQPNGDEDESWDQMETEEADTAIKYQELMKEAMEYGQVLMREYGDEKWEYKRTLNNYFSLIAYDGDNVKASTHGHLMDSSGRVLVAEELNSAILVSLGRPSSAAVEKLFRQTEALIDAVSQDGGPAAFVNLQRLLH